VDQKHRIALPPVEEGEVETVMRKKLHAACLCPGRLSRPSR
jgi:hypothetical protein